MSASNRSRECVYGKGDLRVEFWGIDGVNLFVWDMYDASGAAAQDDAQDDTATIDGLDTDSWSLLSASLTSTTLSSTLNVPNEFQFLGVRVAATNWDVNNGR